MKLKMKYSFLFLMIISIFIISCQSVNEKKILRFKNYVGHENFEATDNFLHEMEEKLEETYQTGSINQNIKSYLNDVSNEVSRIEFSKGDCDALYWYQLNGMENKWAVEEFDEIFVDSLERLVMIVELGTRIHLVKHISEQEFSEKEKTKRMLSASPQKHIHYGKLIGGLEYIAESDSLILNYIEHIKMVGEIHTKLTADALIHEGISDFESNYFCRLIVLLEIYSLELREFGCI